MTPFVVPLVIGSGIVAIGPGWDTRSESEVFQTASEFVTVVGLVGQNGPMRVPFHQIWSAQNVVSMPGTQEQPQRPTVGIHQCVNLGVGSTTSPANSLFFSTARSALSMFVYFDAGRVDAPKLPFGPLGEFALQTFPKPLLAPFLPAGVNGRVGSEDAQCPPGAAFTQTEKQRLQDGFQSKPVVAPFSLER